MGYEDEHENMKHEKKNAVFKICLTKIKHLTQQISGRILAVFHLSCSHKNTVSPVNQPRNEALSAVQFWGMCAAESRLS